MILYLFSPHAALKQITRRTILQMEGVLSGKIPAGNALKRAVAMLEP